MTHDYSGFISSKSDLMTQVADMATEMVRRQQVVEERKKALKEAEKELEELEENRLPELMDQLGLGSVKTSDGLVVDIDEKIRANITKANEKEAFTFLRENGGAALIKNVVSLQFGMGEEQEARDCLTRLSDMPVEQKTSVHPATLAKFCREALEAGLPLPVEVFGIHRQRKAIVKTK